MILRRIAFTIVFVLAMWGSVSGGRVPQKAASSSHTSLSPPRAFFEHYCITCHNQKLRTAGLTLDTMDLANVGAGAETWEKVIRKLRMRAMPPVGRPRPDGATYDAVASWLETEIDRAAEDNPNPGRTEAFHRLNRVEYQNAIRDLLGVDIKAASLLPADDADKQGFDTNANVLSVSPTLMERYLSASRKIARLAVGDPMMSPVEETYKLPERLFQDDRMSEDLPFGSRGGVAIHHRFPVDGEYVIKIRLQRNYVDCIRGLDAPHQLEVRLDDARISLFTVGGEARWRPAPASYCGNLSGDPEWEKYIRKADEPLEVRVAVKGGERVVGVSFFRELTEPEGVLQPPLTGLGFANSEMPESNAAIDQVTIGGPYKVGGLGETASRRKIFVCLPLGAADEARCAKSILSTLARRAYRRPVSEEDVQTLVGFYNIGRKQGDFDTGIQTALERLLVDPNFLFRIERDPANVKAGSYHISNLELASRLSFFLWSSIPDDELLGLASTGKLGDPAILERQVRRMMADPRAKALVDNFAGQWLYLRNVRNASPNPDIFPEFDENLREAFQRETELFFTSLLREDRSVLDLLNANYTFVNERLARHYQIPNIYGSRFRRVVFDKAERGGLLGQGSLLMVTSYPNRTSPVLRGKWVLENLFGAPPPPPPPNVPALPARGHDGKPASVRDRLEEHRKNPFCARCHSQMDPLGFALENFDAIGNWRAATEAGTLVDASGALPDGSKFDGLAGLRNLLMERRELFITTVIEKLLGYALGRAVQYYDFTAIRRIMREAAPNDYRWSSIILGVVKSAPFQMRRSES